MELQPYLHKKWLQQQGVHADVFSQLNHMDMALGLSQS